MARKTPQARTAATSTAAPVTDFQSPANVHCDAPASPVAAAAPRDPMMATPGQLGEKFGRMALTESRAVSEFADVVKADGAHADYAKFVAFRDAFKAGATAAGYADADSLWSRTWKAAKGFGFLPDYPKATGAAATKKQGQRAAAAAAHDAIVQGKTPVQIRAEAEKAAKAGDYKAAAKLTDAAAKAEKDIAKAAAEKARDATKNQVERIRAALKRLADNGDVAKLAQLLKLAEKLAPAPAAATV